MRDAFLLFAGLSVVAVHAVACGSTVTGSGSGGMTSGTGAHPTTTTTVTGTGGGSPAGCPSAAPDPGTPCPVAEQVCGYGNSVFAECRAAFLCHGGVWISSTMSCPIASPGCPSSPPQDMSSCDGDAGYVICGYPDGQICNCSQCPPVGGACMPMPAKWYCGGPSGPAGCPALIPNQGSSCTDATLKCKYPSGCGIEADCVNGAWKWMQFGCPG